jgi:DNA (cytosine-5)-methyltransferase 1
MKKRKGALPQREGTMKKQEGALPLVSRVQKKHQGAFPNQGGTFPSIAGAPWRLPGSAGIPAGPQTPEPGSYHNAPDERPDSDMPARGLCGPKGRENIAQGRGRRPMPWVPRPHKLSGLKGRENLDGSSRLRPGKTSCDLLSNTRVLLLPAKTASPHPELSGRLGGLPFHPGLRAFDLRSPRLSPSLAYLRVECRSMKIPILSLFCGCGGLDLGFTQAGFGVALALDNDPVAVSTYNSNSPGKIAGRLDLSSCSSNEIHELLGDTWPVGVIGGPPCQPFSNGNNTRVTEDQLRKSLPGRYAALLADLNRKSKVHFFVFENVRGITFEKHQEDFCRFKCLFEEAGFRIFEGWLDAHDFGVPQSRPRVFVVGFNRDEYGDIEYSFPAPQDCKLTVRDALHGLPEPLFFRPALRPEDIPHHPNHWTMRPRSEKFRTGFLREGHIKGKSFKVLAWDKPSCTVAYGNREIHIHPSGTRRLSVYEAMLLQGFPKSYRLAGTLSDQIRQVSDAVPPPLAKALALSIREILCCGAEQFEGEEQLPPLAYAG